MYRQFGDALLYPSSGVSVARRSLWGIERQLVPPAVLDTDAAARGVGVFEWHFEPKIDRRSRPQHIKEPAVQVPSRPAAFAVFADDARVMIPMPEASPRTSVKVAAPRRRVALTSALARRKPPSVGGRLRHLTLSVEPFQRAPVHTVVDRRLQTRGKRRTYDEGAGHVAKEAPVVRSASDRASLRPQTQAGVEGHAHPVD